MSIPTHCPQRNERLGWSGDISVFSRTATYLATVPEFLRRHMQAMRDVQREDGRFSDVAPLGGGFGGVLWGSAGITVAWECFQQYGDKVLLNEHYDAMKKYVQYILDKCVDSKTNVLIQEKIWGNLGDWLSLEDEKNDKTLLWESYFLYDLKIMNKIATLLNKNSDADWYRKLYEGRRRFFNNTYIQPQTGRTISSGANGPKKGDLIDIQTSYVLPLAFDIVNDSIREKFANNLRGSIVRENTTDHGWECPPHSLITGFIGTAWVNQVLSDNGYNKDVYLLLQQTSYPSWLYSVKQGATTIWERLNSYTHSEGFGGNNRMNSFNHYSFGAVGAWMYSNSLGIARDENSPGFKHFILQPEPDPTKQMNYAKGYYDSMYGRIESSWERKESAYYYHFVVPANTTGTLCLDASSVNEIVENGKLFKSSQGVRYLGKSGNKEIFEIESGEYWISVKY